MSSSEQIDSRARLLIEWLIASVLKLREHRISPGLVQMIVDRLEEHGGTADAIGLRMMMAGLGMKADWAWEEGRLDEAQMLFERLMSLVKPDDSRYYLETAGMVRVLFDKDDQAAAFDLMGRSAMAAMNAEGLPIWHAFDMLALAQFGDLAASLESSVFLEAVAQYESRCLADRHLALAVLWHQDPQEALDTLLEHSPHPPSKPGSDAAGQGEGDSA